VKVVIEHLAEYAGLLAASFLAATVLPFQSEAVLFALLLTKHYT
jgi:membrane protein YqaA with SNARE-associated domain